MFDSIETSDASDNPGCSVSTLCRTGRTKDPVYGRQFELESVKSTHLS